MIRDRRPEDLDRLSEVLAELAERAEVLPQHLQRAWLESTDAECSWVFDQAPVVVTPTRNIVGHVQFRPAPDTDWAREAAAQLGEDHAALMMIGRLFVKPSKHDHGIARYLLKESVKHVQGQGSTPLLDPDDPVLIPSSLPARLGFAPVRTSCGAVLVAAQRRCRIAQSSPSPNQDLEKTGSWRIHSVGGGRLRCPDQHRCDGRDGQGDSEDCEVAVRAVGRQQSSSQRRAHD